MIKISNVSSHDEIARIKSALHLEEYYLVLRRALRAPLHHLQCGVVQASGMHENGVCRYLAAASQSHCVILQIDFMRNISAIVQVPTALHRSVCSAQNKYDFSPTLVELILLHTPHHCQCCERAGSEVHVSCREAMDHGSACYQVSDRR